MPAARVWVLVDDRPGSTSQSLALAAAVGLPFEVKTLAFGPLAALHNRVLDRRGGSLLGLRRARSSPLAPPWPELVIAAGRRTAPVAQWIRRASGGLTRLVQLGRKGADDAGRFDLCVTPAYGRVHPHPNRIVIRAPLHAVSSERIRAACAEWEPRFARLRPPRVGALVGGRSGQYWMDAAIAARLARDLRGFAEARGASLIVSTSRRTGATATRALQRVLPPGTYLHCWRAGELSNPYLALLGLCDELVVTADSESMLAEAAASGRPVHIYPLPERASFPGLRLLRGSIERRAGLEPGARSARLRALAARAIERGFVRPARDLSELHDELRSRGLAVRFGEERRAQAVRPIRELETVAARVRQLVLPGSANPSESAF
jgi:hypothetical protein